MAAATLLLTSPFLGSFLTLRWLGYSVFDYTPFLNDEVSYYLQARAFAAYGWQAGYFGIGEDPAPASFSRFGVHGPAFPVLYGSAGRLVGLPYWMGYFLNCAALTLGLVVYLALARPAAGACAALALLVLSFWPFQMYVATWMQESLHFAVAVVMAGVFAALIARRPFTTSPVFRVAVVALVAAASLLRVSWALAYVPLFLLYLNRRRPLAVAGALAAGAAAAALFMVVFRWLCAPYNADPDAFLMNKLAGLGVGPEHLWRHVRANLAAFGQVFELESVVSRTVFAEHLTALGAVAFAALAYGLGRRWPRLRADLRRLAKDPAGLALCAYYLLATTAATVLTYYVGQYRGYRVFAIELMLLLALAAASRSPVLRGAFAAALVANLLVAGPALNYLRAYYAEPFHGRAAADAFAARVADLIRFEPGADGWSNTLLSDRLPGELSALPAGIGVELYLDAGIFRRPIKSRYVITTPDIVARLRLPLRPLFRLDNMRGQVRTTPLRPVLYLNSVKIGASTGRAGAP